MDDDIFLQIIMLVLLLVGASFCASSEMAFASMNTVRMKTESKKGSKKATNALAVVDRFDKALITLLIGNNLTHVGFASLVTLMATKLWGVDAVAYTTIATTVILFLISELVPKSYAKSNSDTLALNVSGPLLKLMFLFTPIAKVFSFINVILNAVLPEKEEEQMSDEELMDMIDIAHAEGSLDDEETHLVKLAIQFEEKKVKDIYKKLQNVEMLDIESSNREAIDIIKEERYSRMPVYELGRDQIVGILHTSQYLKALLADETVSVKGMMGEPIFVSEDKLINDLLTELSTNKLHMAIVRNAGGKVIGIVTLEDILEELVGEIWDEND